MTVDRRKYFMINLHESTGPCRDRNHNPWIGLATDCTKGLGTARLKVHL